MVLSGKVKGALVKEGHGLAVDVAVMESCFGGLSGVCEDSCWRGAWLAVGLRAAVGFVCLWLGLWAVGWCVTEGYVVAMSPTCGRVEYEGCEEVAQRV